MEAGKVLQEVKALCADKKYEEAKSLIEKNKENLEEKYPIAQEFIELKQGTKLLFCPFYVIEKNAYHNKKRNIKNKLTDRDHTIASNK